MSKIEVNTVDTQCGTNLTVGSACKSVTVAGNDIRSNAYKAGDGGNLVSQSGTTITLGASGDTVSLASGASQTGFGRTGTVDWDTTAKTASFTAVSGNGYFINTTSGAITVTLPASPSAGDIVSIADYTNTFQTNAVTVARNGSNIGGISSNATLSTEGQSVTFIYVDATEGWKNVQDSTSNVTGNPNLVATGGTITTSGDYKIHTFTGPGTFTVCNSSTTAANNIVSYLVVGGGGGAGGGGGGAGGFREYKGPADCYTASPLNGNPGGTAVTVTAQAYPITVGAGGSGNTGAYNTPYDATPGANSVFSTITSAGGGVGGFMSTSIAPINNGGSGGGGGHDSNGPGGSGNTPPVSPPQGNSGGFAPAGGFGGGGGGGGATGAGSAGGGPGNPATGGNGGAGATTSISASPTAYAGGGGGGANTSATGTGGSGGTGGGGGGAGDDQGVGSNGSTNTGGGAGGSEYEAPNGAAGGSGIVIIRYKFQ
jgi:hypothetical protein